MQKINIEDKQYEITKDYKNGFNKEEFERLYTDYFYEFDYIVGDWAYGKLRLKGFYKSNNKNCSELNNIENLDSYLKNNCAFDCKYFVAKRI